MVLTKVARSVSTDVIALCTLIAVGVIGMQIYNIPSPVSVIALLCIALCQAFAVSAIVHDDDSHVVRNRHDRQFIIEIIGFGLLAGILSYLNYLGYFVREVFSPSYIDTSLSFYREAATIAIVTLLLCLIMNVLFVRADTHKHPTVQHLRNNKKLIRVWILAFVVVLLAVYVPLFQSLFGTASLSFVDWAQVVLAVTIYGGCYRLQRYTQNHTREALVQLHKMMDIHKHV